MDCAILSVTTCCGSSSVVIGLGSASSTSVCFFFSSRRRHTRFDCDWSSDVCSSDLFRRRPVAMRGGGEAGSAARRTRCIMPERRDDFKVSSTERQIVKALGSIGSATDRKSTRLNSSHSQISYAVFCLINKLQRYHMP